MGGVRPMQRMDKTEIIDASGDMRKQIADPRAALTVLFESPGDLSRFPVAAN